MLYEETRKALFQTVLKLYHKDMIPLSSGNVSLRASAEHLVITPSGIPYDEHRDQAGSYGIKGEACIYSPFNYFIISDEYFMPIIFSVSFIAFHTSVMRSGWGLQLFA